MRRESAGETLDWVHDAAGRAVGFTWQGEHFFYIHNLLGDVVAIVCESGEIVAECAFDAYGNTLYMSGPLAEINPLRWRGYYFCAAAGLYYLHTRFYNPSWGRFLNPDAFLVAGNALTAVNL